MAILALIIFCACPIMSLPFIFVGLKKDKKHLRLYLMIIAVFAALFSYIYRPTESEDLYRHHLEVAYYEDKGVDELFPRISSMAEPLSITYKYIISKTGNQNLLQFFTSIVCYYIILYLLTKYSVASPVRQKWKLISVWIFVISCFRFLMIASSVFYVLAIEIFALAVFMDYHGKGKKSIVLMLVSIMIHTSAVLPVAIFIVYKVLGSKITVRNVCIIGGAVLLTLVLIPLIASWAKTPLFSEIASLYKAYFNNEIKWAGMHSVGLDMLRMLKMAVLFVAAILSRSKGEKMDGFSIVLCIIIIILYPQAASSIRYVSLAVLCGIPMLFKAAENSKYGEIYCLLLPTIAVPDFVSQVRQISSLGDFNGIERVFITNIITTLAG